MAISGFEAPGSVGHIAGEVGQALGLYSSEPTLTVGNNAIRFENNPFGALGAITFGNTITFGGSPKDLGADDNPLGIHEEQHTYQGEALGPLYLPANIIGMTASLLSGGKGISPVHRPANFMESGPQEHPPGPWK